MPRSLTGLIGLLVVVPLIAPSAARANGEPGGGGPPTVFERFVLSACSPCVRETYAIASMAVAPMTLPAFPQRAAGPGSRATEIRIDVLRAQQLGRRDWISLALRLTLLVAAPGSEMYRLGVGLLDGSDVRPLAAAVAEMARLAAAPPANPSAESTDVDFHGGSLRVGVLQLRGETVAYVQAGDLPTLMQRGVWEVPTTVYLPVKDLSALAAALGQAAATLDTVRGN